MKIAANEAGKGPTLVFLHGFCESNKIWDDFIVPFRRSFHVITPDIPGFGSSPLPMGNFSLKDVAESILFDLEHVYKVKKSIWIGHSMGGYIALEALKQKPESLSGLCLLNSSCFADSRQKKASRNKLINFIHRQGVGPFVRTFVPSLFYPPNQPGLKSVIEALKNEAMKLQPQSIQHYAGAMRDRNDNAAIMKRNKYKMLIIAGKEDQNVTAEISTNMGYLVGMDKLHLLEKAAHMLMFEKPAETQRILLEFCEQMSDN